MDAAVLLGPAVALVVFSGTQIIKIVTDRQQFLQKKLEELIDGLNFMGEKTIDLLHKLDYGAATMEAKELPDLARAISKATYKPNTIIELYFPYLGLVWGKVMESFKEAALLLDTMSRQDKLDCEVAYSQLEETLRKLYWLRRVMALNSDVHAQSFRFVIRSFFRLPIRLEMPGPMGRTPSQEEGREAATNPQPDGQGPLAP